MIYWILTIIKANPNIKKIIGKIDISNLSCQKVTDSTQTSYNKTYSKTSTLYTQMHSSLLQWHSRSWYVWANRFVELEVGYVVFFSSDIVWWYDFNCFGPQLAQSNFIEILCRYPRRIYIWYMKVFTILLLLLLFLTYISNSLEGLTAGDSVTSIKTTTITVEPIHINGGTTECHVALDTFSCHFFWRSCA